MIYLDNAATTLHKPGTVWKSMEKAMRTCSTPGRGTHAAAMNAADAAFSCRETAAGLFGVENPEQVALTFNATHGLNLAIHTLAGQGKTAVITGYEHNAVVRPLYSRGLSVRQTVSPLFDQARAADAFYSAIREGADFAVCTHVSNVFGFVLPVEKIAEICAESDVPLIVDASQSAGVLALNLADLGPAFVAMPGHKGLYGPQGTGLLLCGRTPEPLLMGGTGGNSDLRTMPDFLPDRVEAGTGNISGAAGLAAGMRFVQTKGVGRICRHEVRLKNAACAGLERLHGVHPIWTEDEILQTGVFSMVFDNLSPIEAAAELGKRGIAVRAGLHCAPAAHRTAGTHDSGTVRVSFSVFSTMDDVHALISAVRAIRR